MKIINILLYVKIKKNLNPKWFPENMQPVSRLIVKGKKKFQSAVGQKLKIPNQYLYY